MIISMNSTYSINEWINIKNKIDEKIENGYDIDIDFLYYDFIKLNLNIKSGLSTLIINYYKNNLNNVNTLFLDDLPYVDILEFNSTKSIGLNHLENKLQNLPITISLIKFNLMHLDKNIVNTGNFNFLFNIKKPFGCKMILNIIYDTYNENISIPYIVNETDNNKQLELNFNNNKIIINYYFLFQNIPQTPLFTFYKCTYSRYTNFTIETVTLE